MVAVWLNRYPLIFINIVALHQAWLVLGWITICNCKWVTSHSGQLSLAIPPWIDDVTMSESRGVNIAHHLMH